MNNQEFRERFEAWWEATSRREIANKNSQGVLWELFKLYETLEPSERKMAEAIVCEWIVSGDPNKRFDAVAFADRFRCQQAAEYLLALKGKLEKETGPAARYELAKVERVLLRLEESSPKQEPN